MTRVLRKGCRGKDVKTLQNLLNLYEDGIFGAITEEAVKAFQASHGLMADGVVGEKTWVKLLSPENERLKKSTRDIKEIIIHCTATPEGKSYNVNDITRWHKQRGFSTIGYHYVIYLDGSIHLGRDVNTIGAHCTGHNSYSIGIAYVGGCASNGSTPKDTRTPYQKAALRDLLIRLKALYPKAKIYGHCDFANKACPSFDATKEYKNI